MKENLFWAGISGLLLGILMELLIPLGFNFAAALVFVALVLWFLKKEPSYFLYISGVVFLMAFAIGVVRVELLPSEGDLVLERVVGQTVLFEGRIAGEVDERERTVRIPIEIHALGGEVVKTHARILVVSLLPHSFEYGQYVRVEGVLEKPESFASDGGRRFNYPAFLAKDNIYYTSFLPKIEVTEESEASVQGALFAIKKWYVEGLALALPEPHAALAGGITVGDKRALGGDLLDIFRITGIIHIVVLSGYNITIVVDAVRRILKPAPRLVGISVSALFIVLFVIATGATATGVRAGAMAGIALLAKATYRNYAISRALALAAVGMVLWSPLALLYDPGFQLSVLATIGLIYVAPRIEGYFLFVTEKWGLREIVGATIGTQIFVLPLLLYQTGLFSVVALPVNLLVLPVIPLAMLFSFIAGVAGAVSSTVGVFVAYPAYLLLSYTLMVSEWSATLPAASLSVDAFGFGWVVASYIVLAGSLLALKKARH